MQLSFLEAVAPVVTPTPARKPAHPKTSIDRLAHYRDWQDDLSALERHAEALQVWLLFRHLRLLADPLVGAAERADLLDWLCVDPTPPQPFSFIACVRAYDPRLDPAELRDLLLAQLHRRGLKRPLPSAA
jgi:hypothetical protein